MPAVLQGGNHAAIRRWRLKQAVGRTFLRRPDLFEGGKVLGRTLSDEERALLDEFLAEREVEKNG